MMTRRAIVLVALLVLLMPSKGISGILADELQPELGIFSRDTFFDPYCKSLRDSLLGEHDDRMCQVLVIPAFHREWVVYIVREILEPPKVIYKVMKTHLSRDMMDIICKESPNSPWSFNEAAQIKALSKLNKEVERVSAPISEETANLLRHVWTAMLLRVRYPKPSGMIGLDGIQYYVSHIEKGEGKWSGTTWSPEPGSNAGALIEIAQDLRDYAIARAPQQKTLEANIMIKAKRLLASLESETEEHNKK